MSADSLIIANTKRWVETVIVGCNFCPFARRELERDSISYRVVQDTGLEQCLEGLMDECLQMEKDASIETSLVIYPQAFPDFYDFLELIELSNQLLEEQGFEGILQLATFHPRYCFADAEEDDPANYTNRSPYPMLHIIREASLERALQSYPEPELIPERNIEFARSQGLARMEAMLEACIVNDEPEKK